MAALAVEPSSAASSDYADGRERGRDSTDKRCGICNKLEEWKRDRTAIIQI
jgi:hypothetical protein